MSSDPFLDASVALTGFSRVELLGTGLVEAYRAFLAGPELDRLCAGELDRAFAARVAELWYTGTWRPLDGGPMVVPAADSHAEALVWRLFGGTAPGTRPRGFGSWT